MADYPKTWKYAQTKQTRDYTLVDQMRDELLAHIRYLEDTCADLLEIAVSLQIDNTELRDLITARSAYVKTVCPVCGHDKYEDNPHVCRRKCT